MEQRETARGVGRGEEFDQFLAHPLGADETDFLGEFLHGGKGLGRDGEVELRGEANGAEHPQVILAEAFFGRAHGADEFGAQVRLAADPVVQLLGQRIVEESVDREVAADGVLAGVGETHRFRAASVLIVCFGAEGGDLILLPFLDDDHDAKLFTHRDGVREETLGVIGPRIRGDVEVLRLAPKQRVTHAAADEEGLESGGLQLAGDVGGGGAHGGNFNHGWTRMNTD